MEQITSKTTDHEEAMDEIIGVFGTKYEAVVFKNKQSTTIITKAGLIDMISELKFRDTTGMKNPEWDDYIKFIGQNVNRISFGCMITNIEQYLYECESDGLTIRQR